MSLNQYQPYTPVLANLEHGVEDPETSEYVLEPQLKLEQARKLLQEYESEGRYTNEISNAIIAIEQALLHVDHYRQRRANVGILGLPFPEKIDHYIDKVMNLKQCNISISFEEEVNYIQRKGISHCGFTKHYPQHVVPFVYSFMLWVNNNKQVNYLLDYNEEKNTLLITVSLNSADKDRIHHVDNFLYFYNTKNKLIAENEKKDAYVSKLKVVDLITETTLQYDLPPYAIKHNAAYNTRKAFTFFRTLTTKLNDIGVYLLGEYQNMEAMFCFNTSLNESKDVIEDIVREVSEEVGNLNIA